MLLSWFLRTLIFWLIFDGCGRGRGMQTALYYNTECNCKWVRVQYGAGVLQVYFAHVSSFQSRLYVVYNIYGVPGPGSPLFVGPGYEASCCSALRVGEFYFPEGTVVPVSGNDLTRTYYRRRISGAIITLSGYNIIARFI